MKMFRFLLKLTIIISLLANSTGQSYALRPMAAACKSSPTGNKPEPLLNFPKWLRERLEPELTQDIGKEAAQFVLRDCGFAFIGLISDIPRRLRKKLKPVKYFNQIVVCENAISSMAKILKKAIPRYKSLSVKSVETELLQVALYYGELELKIKQRELSFDKLKEEILKVYGETRIRCPEFRAFLKGVSRQYGYNFRKDTKLLRKLIVHFITEVVLFGNLPKVILDSSGRSNKEEDIRRDIVRACIKFIEETKLISGGEIKTLKELAKKGGASQREKKKMALSIFDFMPRKKAEEKIRRALKEDKQRKDKTSRHTIRRKQQATFVIEAQQKGVLAGLEIAMLVFKMVNPRLEVKPLLLDGDELRKGKPILIVRGNARSVIGAERVALNYLQQLSGIATMTAKFVKPTAGTNVKILDTRKTTPGMRAFQKYAVRIGGGKNHRMDLEEMDLIKDTHLDLIRQELGKDEGIITEAVKRARAEDKNIFIEVEVQSVKEAKEALENGVDRIMLDNMPCSEMKKVVKFVRRSEYYKLHGKPTIEASGNVNLRTVGPIAGTGVEYISVGLITRSAPSLDIHLKVKPVAEEVDINKLVSALTKAMRADRIAAGILGPKIKSSSAGNGENENIDLSSLAKRGEFKIIKLLWGDESMERVNEMVRSYAEQVANGLSMGRGYSMSAYNEGDSFIPPLKQHFAELEALQEVSFQSDLKDAEILIIGPGPYANEITKFIEMFPDLKAIHLFTLDRQDLENADIELRKLAESSAIPPVYAYIGNIVWLPPQLAKMLEGKFDIVYEASVINFSDYSDRQIFEALRQIERMLKVGGLYVSVTGRKECPLDYLHANELFQLLKDREVISGIGCGRVGLGLKKDNIVARRISAAA